MKSLPYIMLLCFLFTTILSCEKDEDLSCEWVYNYCCDVWERECYDIGGPDYTNLQSDEYTVSSCTIDYFPVLRRLSNDREWGAEFESKINAREITSLRVELSNQYNGNSSLYGIPGASRVSAGFSNNTIKLSKTETSYTMPPFLSFSGPEVYKIYVSGHIKTTDGRATQGHLEYTNNDEIIMEYRFNF